MHNFYKGEFIAQDSVLRGFSILFLWLKVKKHTFII